MYDDALIYNDIRLQRRDDPDALIQTAEDTDSMVLYGRRTLSIGDLLHSTTAATLERAEPVAEARPGHAVSVEAGDAAQAGFDGVAADLRDDLR